MELEEIGIVVHFYNHLGVAIVWAEGVIKKGDHVLILGHTTDFEQDIRSMEEKHHRIDIAKKGHLVGIKVADKVRPHDKVYLMWEKH
jgi:GTPase